MAGQTSFWLATNLVLLATLQGSMGLKRTIGMMLRLTSNDGVAGLSPQTQALKKKKITLFFYNSTWILTDSHFVGWVKTKTCQGSSSHSWDCVTIFGVLRSSRNGGSGPHYWSTEITSEKANVSVALAPLISFEKSLLCLGHWCVFKPAWTCSAAILF